MSGEYDDFLKALGFAYKWEVGHFPNGGYTNDSNDPGGETKWGVSKGSYPHLDIANLTQEDATWKVYFPDYWARGGNQESFCSEMRYPLNAVHFDCVVNVGNRKIARDGTVVMHRKANMILQRALGVPDDGYIGPVTVAAIEQANPADVARRAIQQRDMYYATLGAWSFKYQAGWARRTTDLRRTFLA